MPQVFVVLRGGCEPGATSIKAPPGRLPTTPRNANNNESATASSFARPARANKGTKDAVPAPNPAIDAGSRNASTTNGIRAKYQSPLIDRPIAKPRHQACADLRA